MISEIVIVQTFVVIRITKVLKENLNHLTTNVNLDMSDESSIDVT